MAEAILKEQSKLVYSVAETCKELGLGRNTLMNLINSGKLKAVKAGERRWLIPNWALKAFLEQPKLH